MFVAISSGAAAADKAPFGNNDVRNALSGGLDAGSKATIDEYFTKYLFKHFQQPSGTEDPPYWRAQFKILVRGIGKSPAHDYLNELAFGQCSKLLLKNPQIGYNAMLLIGELNESDDTRSGIKPYPAALGRVFQVLTLKRADLDYLKPAALVALARYAEEGAIPPAKAADVTSALLALVNQKDPPPGRTGSAHNYMRRKAAEVLAYMHHPGPGNNVAKAFEAILSDPQSNRMTQCEMARFLGMLKYPAASAGEVQRLGNLLGHQIVDLCEAEIARAGKDSFPSRRLIMYILDANSEGLSGLSESVERGSEQQKFIGGLRGKISPLLKDLADLDEGQDAEAASKVSPKLLEIKELLTPKASATGPLAAAGSKEEAATPPRTN